MRYISIDAHIMTVHIEPIDLDLDHRQTAVFVGQDPDALLESCHEWVASVTCELARRYADQDTVDQLEEARAQGDIDKIVNLAPEASLVWISFGPSYVDHIDTA